MRVVIAPVGGATLIDALVLDDGRIGDRAAGAVRATGLVPQSAGIQSEVSSRGVVLVGKSPEEFEATKVTMGADGAVAVEAGARAGGSMGGMAISYPRVQQIVEASGRLAHDLWDLVPDGDRVRQVAATVSIPDANHHPLVVSGEVGGGSMSMPSVPSPLVAPDPPVVVPRASVGTPEMTRRLAVSIKQAFADYGAVQQ